VEYAETRNRLKAETEALFTEEVFIVGDISYSIDHYRYSSVLHYADTNIAICTFRVSLPEKIEHSPASSLTVRDLPAIIKAHELFMLAQFGASTKVGQP
jgi:hypothetical protein